MRQLNVGIIGYKFMGRAHSNAWKKASLFFDIPFQPVLKVACGRHLDGLTEFADKWGWEETETDWRRLIERDDIDVIDIATPQHLHAEIALAAAKAGKHLFCEKPLAMTSTQGEEMLRACQASGVTHYLNHNYRRVPAIALAKRMIDDGLIGTVYHWRAAYQQDWITDPNFPLTWQLQRELAQAGPQWDLNSHCVDLAHYLVGQITDVTALTRRFIDQRPLAMEGAMGNLKAEASRTGMGQVTVEDAALMLVNFKNGAVGSFEATRFANGRKNKLSFEIYGSDGAVTFDLERLNELRYFSNRDPDGLSGFRTLLTTDESHPYIKNWWPAGHIIGYEHTFIHAIADFVTALGQGTAIKPDFSDGVAILKVLEAGLKSATERKTVTIEY